MSSNGLNLGQGIPVGSTPPPTTPPPPPSGANPNPSLDFNKAIPLGETDPDPGYLINDVGNKVIVPKEGEEFQDTIKRAVAHWKSLPPNEQQRQLNAEVATMPEKVPEALTGAAIAGIAGPAILAAPGEIGGLFTSPGVGLLPPIVKAMPHIVKFAKVLGQLGVGTGAAIAILKELGVDDKKK